VADSNIRVSVQALDDLMNLVGQRLNLITTELQAKVMKTRMQPI
jgi:chemotaxis protein histidine kinase CheA